MKKITAAMMAATMLALSPAPVLAASFFNPATDTVFLEANDPLTWIASYTPTAGTNLAGVSSLIRFNFLGTPTSDALWNFSFDILNTSTGAGSQSELNSFGFDSSGAETGITTPAGSRYVGALNTGAFNGLGSVDVCLYAGSNCNGGASNGVAVGEGIVSGLFTLTYASPLASQTLDGFVARWQSTGVNANGSASGPGDVLPPGTPTPFGSGVPEPSTWAMMLVGFGVLGTAMRRKKGETARTRVRFA